MGWLTSTLQNWDRRNQRTLEDLNGGNGAPLGAHGWGNLHWEPEGDGWRVAGDRRFGVGAVLTRTGVRYRSMVGLQRHVEWDRIAALSYSCEKNGYFLCSCVYGSPYPKALPAVSSFASEVRGWLEPIRHFVESIGAEVINRKECALWWWPRDRRARHGQRRTETDGKHSRR